MAATVKITKAKALKDQNGTIVLDFDMPLSAPVGDVSGIDVDGTTLGSNTNQSVALDYGGDQSVGSIVTVGSGDIMGLSFVGGATLAPNQSIIVE